MLESGRLHRHSATRGEIDDYLMKARRAVHDASADVVSADNRFVIAYNGALSAATAPLVAAGYRPSAAGHHQTVFEALPMVAEAMAEVADYFDMCRRRRHQALYGRFGQISEAETAELVDALTAFIDQVKAWLMTEHPDLYPGAD